eukprot:CAMPEP_0183557408 /NCGR_PEP_ID=MMETSP0371-20130417/85349_1 /TAXON_ID=268820 /ORGANISM="Peridinium aciculiferum, Strain PAER-2" /LENGTH=64 /DNA_ID=CAMNT_0025764385 /DNA_START=11 /DNA_END=202 /DNA_ORIENTATION=+
MRRPRQATIFKRLRPGSLLSYPLTLWAKVHKQCSETPTTKERQDEGGTRAHHVHLPQRRMFADW